MQGTHTTYGYIDSALFCVLKSKQIICLLPRGHGYIANNKKT